jgi:hypothetical protein
MNDNIKTLCQQNGVTLNCYATPDKIEWTAHETFTESIEGGYHWRQRAGKGETPEIAIAECLLAVQASGTTMFEK